MPVACPSSLQGEKGRVAWACGSRGGTKELPICQPARRVGRDTQTPRGKNTHVAVSGGLACMRAEEGARKPPALSQRSPLTFHLHPDPGRTLLNLRLCLRNWRPAQVKIMVTTTA